MNQPKRIDQVAQVLMGQSPSSSTCSEDGHGTPFIQGNAEFRVRYPVPKLKCSSPTRIAEKGDFLLSVRAPVGELNQANQRLVIGRGLSAIRFPDVDQPFSWHALKSAAYKLNRVAQGSTFVAVNRNDVESLEIPWFQEELCRRNIAYVLDTIDEAIAQTESVIAKLKQVRAGMLHDLLSYGLDEYSQLRDPIAHPEQFKESPLGLIPRDWDCKPISVFCDSYAGGTPSRGMPSFFGGDIPWVKSGEVNLESISATEETLTQAGFNASSTKWIPEGTPLIAMYGATAGQVTWLSIRATCNQAVLAIVPFSDTANSRFVFWYLRRVAPQIVKLATGSGQPNLSKTIIDRTNIALPKSLQEQETIAGRIDRIVELQNAEIHNLHKLEALKSGIQDDLLTGRVRVPETIMEGAENA